MPPLTRHDTNDSLLSWWSDSNPLLVGNPIHAASKPLMGHMYHRNVLDLIKRQQGIPLSAETMEIYASYMGSRYVSDASKIAILTELRERAEGESAAETIIMTPLARQVTHESLLSWWSDSNPPGATFSLHAAAKPLMKWMYHRDVLKFIKHQQRVPLSVETMEIYSSYLEWKYVSDASKIAILAELRDRANVEAEAQAIAASSWLLDMMLQPSARTAQLSHACRILGVLAERESTVGCILKVEPCLHLTALLRGSDIEVVGSAMYALCRIARYGPDTVVKAGAQELAPELLDSASSEIRKETCFMLGNLAMHDSTAGAVLAVKPCMRLVTFLRTDIRMVGAAIYALAQIALGRRGAVSVVNAGAQNLTPALLDSPSGDVRRWACLMLGDLAKHDSTAGAVLAVNPCTRLVSLLRDGDIRVLEAAIHALARIASSRQGAVSVVKAGAQQLTSKLLAAPSSEVRRWTCVMLGYLAMDDSTVGTILAVKPCIQLAALLRDGDIRVVEAAIHALGQIALRRQGGVSVAGAGAQDLTPTLLDSLNGGVERWVCFMLGNLAAHDSTVDAVLAVKPCIRLVALLRDTDISVVEGAIYALSRIAGDRRGAVSVVQAGAHELTPKLLHSPNSKVRKGTCRLLENLARHGSTVAPVIATRLCVQLVALLRDANINVVTNATWALSQIARDRKGAEAIVNARVQSLVPKLLDSPNSEVRKPTCWMLGNLAAHDSTFGAVLAVKPCVQLAALSRDSNIHLVDGAIYALSQLAPHRKGAEAVVNAGVHNFALKLLNSPKSEIRYRTCWMLGNLAYRNSTKEAVIAVKPSVRLLGLLNDTDIFVVQKAIYALSQIAHGRQGAEAVVDAGAQNLSLGLLGSHNSEVRRWTSWMLGNLARHNSTRGYVVAVEPCVRLVTLLHDGDTFVVQKAIYALSQIAHDVQGAEAVVDTGTQNLSLKLLGSRNMEVRRWTGWTLGNLAKHDSTVGAVVAVEPCERLVALLR
ncbi:armadillo-type protein [Mycena crocata]|nr:armadillo-type protein [Mycena crocata]